MQEILNVILPYPTSVKLSSGLKFVPYTLIIEVPTNTLIVWLTKVGKLICWIVMLTCSLIYVDVVDVTV